MSNFLISPLFQARPNRRRTITVFRLGIAALIAIGIATILAAEHLARIAQ